MHSGPNAWLVDEMFEQYRADPSSVSESWREFFADYQRDTDSATGADVVAAGHRPGRRHRSGRRWSPPTAAPGGRPRPRPTSPGNRRPRSLPRPPRSATGAVRTPARHGARKASPRASPSAARPPGSWPTWRPASTVPTATSFREVPAKLLEVNRLIINGYLGRTRGGKISFTHLIGYAIVRAIADAVPAMNSSYVEDADGKPRVVRHDHVGLGLAVDVEKKDGGAHAVRAGHQGRRHARLPGVLGAPTRTSSARCDRTSSRPTTSPAPPSPSPTRAPSAPSSRCPRLMPGQGVDRRRRPRSTTRPRTRAPTRRCWPTSACRR